MKLLKKIVALLGGGLVLLWPAVAYQQAPFVTCTGLNCTVVDLLAVPVRIFNWLMGLAGFILLLVVVWSGTRMLLFYLSEMPEQELRNAKLTLTRGIFGFAVIAMAFLVVNIIIYSFFGGDLNDGLMGWLIYFGI